MIEATGERCDVPASARGAWQGWLGRRLTDADLRHDGNAFTLLRCGLAAAVIYTHAIGMTGATDPLRAVLPFAVSRLAVLLFFTLSGFMVTASFVRRGVVAFVVARALRIVPGLWVMLAATTLVLGFGFSDVPASRFFAVGNLADYVGRNMLLIGGGAYRLPGVFAGNVAPEVNRSLWSIPQEVHCYLTLVVVGLAGALARRRLVLAGLGGLIGLALTPFGAAVAFVPLAVSFYAGVTAYLWRDRLVVSWPLAAAAIAAGLALPEGLAQTGCALAFAYAAVVAAVALPAGAKRVAARLPDYSYGIYIYAFPVQQAVIALGWTTTAAANIAVSLAVVVPLAALSWHVIEQPALALKGRRHRRDAAVAAAFVLRPVG